MRVFNDVFDFSDLKITEEDVAQVFEVYDPEKAEHDYTREALPAIYWQTADVPSDADKRKRRMVSGILGFASAAIVGAFTSRAMR